MGRNGDGGVMIGYPLNPGQKAYTFAKKMLLYSWF